MNTTITLSTKDAEYLSAWLDSEDNHSSSFSEHPKQFTAIRDSIYEQVYQVKINK
jgi:hypothetical protein